MTPATVQYATPVVDAQVHTWIPPSTRYPWSQQHFAMLPSQVRPTYEAGDHSAERAVQMMDEVGVDCALLTSTFLYGTDPSYALDAAQRFPGRFAVVAYVDDTVPHLDSHLGGLADDERVVGLRVFLSTRAGGNACEPSEALVELLDAAAATGLALFVSPMGCFDLLAQVAAEHPETTVVVDHLGLWVDASVEQRLALVGRVLALATHPNVHVKCTAAPELSRAAYPYPDVQALLDRYVDAFGVDRLMWGSDINQHLDSLSYAEAVGYVRTNERWTPRQRSSLLGGTAVRILGLQTPSGRSA